VANTSGEHILAFDIAADGSVSNRRNFAQLDGWKSEEGKWTSGADGLAIDDADRLYVASNSGVEVFSPKGEALGIIELPKKPQNIAFAGTDKKTLYAVGRGAAYKIPLLAQGFKGRAK
jgi:gluconolactonase